MAQVRGRQGPPLVELWGQPLNPNGVNPARNLGDEESHRVGGLLAETPSSDIRLASPVLELLGPASPQPLATFPVGHASPRQATLLVLLLPGEAGPQCVSRL